MKRIYILLLMASIPLNLLSQLDHRMVLDSMISFWPGEGCDYITRYTYDENGNLIQENEYTYIEYTGESALTVTTFNNDGNKIKSIVYVLDSGEYVFKDDDSFNLGIGFCPCRTEYHYDDFGNLTVQSESRNIHPDSAIVACNFLMTCGDCVGRCGDYSKQIVNYYNSLGKVTKQLSYSYRYEYDNGLYITDSTIYSSDSTVFIYDTLNILTEERHWLSDFNGTDWKPSESRKLTYDTLGNVLEEYLYYWTGSWFLQDYSSTDYTFDNDGNIIKKVISGWTDGGSRKINTRVENTYNNYGYITREIIDHSIDDLSGIATIQYFWSELDISNVYFPDTAFLYALIEEGVDTNGDSLINYGEAESVNSLNVAERGITDMTGLEAFTNLDTLVCERNELTSLDVSQNTRLRYLHCGRNQLTVLDVSNNLALTYMICVRNELTTLDVSKNTALTILSCSYNQLTALDVSNNKALKEFWCYDTQLSSLDLSNMPALKFISCKNNQLVHLDVSNNPMLTEVWCPNNRLTSLDVTNCNALSTLNLEMNQLTSMDISTNTSLSSLFCGENQLTSLDVSNSTLLGTLYCAGNKLTSLDISNNPMIGSGDSDYPELDISYMPDLRQVCAWTTPFPPSGVRIDRSGSPNVYFKDCLVPVITAIDSLYQPFSLEVKSSEDGMIYCVPEGTDKNLASIWGVCSDSSEAIANTNVEIQLTDLTNGEYWLYATDNTGNISEHWNFTIYGVGIEHLASNQISIYPNPAHDLLNIETDRIGGYSIEISTLSGQLILSKEKEGPDFQIDISIFQKGIYLLTIRSIDIIITRKIIKY